MAALEDFQNGLLEIERIVAHSEQLLENRENLSLANALTRSGLVLLCGYFEGFIRDLLRDAVDELNDQCVSINDVPDLLLISSLEAALALSGPRRTRAVVELRDQIRTEKPCALDRVKLSMTGGNPTVDTIDRLLERFGVPDVIEKLSVKDFGIDSTYVLERQSAALESAVTDAVGAGNREAVERIMQILDKKWSPKRKRRSVGYVSAVEELLKRRNRIAHGESRESVTPAELTLQIGLLSALAKGLNDVLEEVLKTVSGRGDCFA